MMLIFSPLFQALMVPEQDFMSGLTMQSVMLGVFKIMFLILALIYLAFAVIVIRQIKLMKSTLITTLTPTLISVGYIHLVVSIAILILFFFLL
jgi:hypothetical protein